MKRFGRQIRGETHIQIEVPAGSHGCIHERPDGLVLEDIFVTVQQIDGFGDGSALLWTAKERIEGERRHPAKLPRPCARRKAEKDASATLLQAEREIGRAHV